MFTPFYRDIRPEGWLRRQLDIQAKGLSGNLLASGLMYATAHGSAAAAKAGSGAPIGWTVSFRWRICWMIPS